ncbi:trigger factor [Limisalsivibrio acetivorans]|uniref:trigger factor n=1 Tax=Limisalsivibrio acetivorans TaxID=1304888 RepID=UPI0003B65F16|nr:trigger factor [Limisalsivibrio acetivorans]
MNVEVRDAEKSRKELSVEIPVEKFDEVFEAEYKKTAADVELPGFRKGKAPREEVLKKHGHSIRVKALEQVINSSVFEAIQSEGIQPLSSPDVQDVQFEENEPISFKAYVDVFPAFDVEKYSGYDFTKEQVTVNEGDVDKVLDNLKQQQVSYEPVTDRPVEDGDKVVIDFVGKKDGVPFDNGAAENYSLDIGTKTFIEGFEEQLVGMNAGEEKVIEVTFPEQYHEESLAGQPVTFDVTVKEIKGKKLPELDDDFAKDVDERFETLQQLKDAIREELEENAKRQANDKLLNDMIEKIIEDNQFDVPETLIKDQAEKLAQQSLQQFMQYGMDPAQMGIDVSKIAESHYPTAEKQVKGALIINNITEKNSLQISEEELEKAVADYADKAGMSVEDYRAELEKANQIQALRNTLNTDKVTEYLEENNTIEEVFMTSEEYEAKMKAEAEARQAEAEAAQQKEEE